METALETVAAVNQCELGRWLADLDGKLDPHVNYVRRLHGEFHRVAGLVAEFAITGCREEAEMMMDTGGEFHHYWTQFSNAMKNWGVSIGRPNPLTRRESIIKAG